MCPVSASVICSSNREGRTTAAQPASSSRLMESRWYPSGEAPAMNGCGNCKPRYEVVVFIYHAGPSTQGYVSGYATTAAITAPAPYAVAATIAPSSNISSPAVHHRSMVTMVRAAPTANSDASVDPIDQENSCSRRGGST